MKTTRKVLVVLALYLFVAHCATIEDENDENKSRILENFGKELIEQGRTLLHGTLKRFMVMAPAIFFKLGIAFTLLLIVTVVAANNGFIGFLILIVGLSTLLARFQGYFSSNLVQPSIAGSIQTLPPSVQHHAWIDRNDVLQGIQTFHRNRYAKGPSHDPNLDLRNTAAYYGKYDAN